MVWATRLGLEGAVGALGVERPVDAGAGALAVVAPRPLGDQLHDDVGERADARQQDDDMNYPHPSRSRGSGYGFGASRLQARFPAHVALLGRDAVVAGWPTVFAR